MLCIFIPTHDHHQEEVVTAHWQSRYHHHHHHLHSAFLFIGEIRNFPRKRVKRQDKDRVFELRGGGGLRNTAGLNSQCLCHEEHQCPSHLTESPNYTIIVSLVKRTGKKCTSRPSVRSAGTRQESCRRDLVGTLQVGKAGFQTSL